MPIRLMGIDIVGPFIKTQGRKQLLVIVVDYFTKWVETEQLARISEG